MLKIKSIILLLLTLWLGACEGNSPDVGFYLTGTSTITIINQTEDTLRIASEGWTIVPFKEQTMDTSIASSATLFYTLKTQGKKHYWLKLNKTKYRLFTQPQANDTIIIRSSSEPDSIVFEGNSPQINRFLLKKQVAFGSADADWRLRGSVTRESDEFNRIIQVNDSITQVQLAYLQQHAADIPSWYAKFENDRLLYLNEGAKSNSFLYRRALLNKADTLPANFLTNVKNLVAIQNSDMLGSITYYQFLRDHMFLATGVHLFSSIPSTTQADQDRTDSLYATVQKELTGVVKDVYLAANTSTVIDRRRRVLDTSWISLVEDRDMKDFLHDYLETHQILPDGAEVPYFSLPAMDSTYYEPSSFEGQVVLINFWAIWCKPCYLEFEHENALVEKFADDPVTIVNICVDSDPEKWREVVRQHNLKTLNLIAPDNWNNLLKEKFDICALPQSVLINQKGKIVCNKCPRPSQGIEAQIVALLEGEKQE